MSAGFEYFDAAADIGVIGRGPTLPDAFAQAALAVFALIVSPASVEERDTREVRAHGDRLETLLVNWLNECLYLHDVEGFVARRISVSAFDAAPRAGGEPLRLHGFLHGEELDASRHEPGTVVRAATLREVSVEPMTSGFEARVILDA